MRQDMLIVYVGSALPTVRHAVDHLVKEAEKFGVEVRGRPILREDLPPGHPGMLGIEHSDPVIMTITVHCSMEEVIELLTPNMPPGMHVAPIPSKRLNAD